MSTKKIILFCVISFLCGIGICFVTLKYIFPNIVNVEQDLKGENVYEVEHNECPVEEKKDECGMYVDVSGALNNPGVYCLEEGSLVVDAVKKAGGFTNEVALSYIERSINLSMPITEHQKLYFPSTSELICELKPFTLKEEEVIPNQETNEENNNADDPLTDEKKCININTATITELDSLDGVGASTAQKIIDSRPYSSTSDLLKVSGIGEATYNKFKDNICI